MKKLNNRNDEGDRVRFGLLAFLAALLFLIGLAALIFSIVDLFHGRPSVHHYNETAGGLQIENPLWPSSGKGFWVGLILMVTGLVGLLSAREGTRASIIGFAALAIASTILSFYMMITCIIPVQYNAENTTSSSRATWQKNELILNSLLIAAGALGSIVGLLTSIFTSIYAGCCRNQRDLYSLFPDQSKHIGGAMMSARHPPAPSMSPMTFPYASAMPGNHRMAI